MYQYIINPKTNRKVHINGKIGRKILQNYLSLLKGSGLTFSGEGKKQGPRVIIHGLVDNTELNDLHGNREDYSEERGRFLIHFETLGIEPRWVRPENITIVADLTPEEQLEIDLAGFEDENPQDDGKQGEAKMDTNSYEYLRVHNPKALNLKWRKTRLHSVLFNGPSTGLSTYGDVDYFEAILKTQLGNNWSKRVLDINETLEDVENISRLGIPGRQGTVIRLDLPGHSYAVKVTKKGVSCGDGATGGMGFLKQARMQEIVADFGITGHVYAVFCGKKNLPSFMVMDLMGQRVVDIYGRKTGNLVMSPLHQQQLWHLYKTLDEKVGILHNDGNCLNLMTDTAGNLKLIDFDRSALIENKHLKKRGSYPNLNLSAMVHRSIGSCPIYGINLNLYSYYANRFFENPEHNNGTGIGKWMELSMN